MAHSKKQISKPLLKHLCSVGIGKFKSVINSEATLTLKLTVYAPLEYGGSSCSEVFSRISQFMFENIDGIKTIDIGKIEYDQYAVAFECSMNVELFVNCFNNAAGDTSTVNTPKSKAFSVNGKSFTCGNIKYYEKKEALNYNEVWGKAPFHSKYCIQKYLYLYDVPLSTLNYLKKIEGTFSISCLNASFDDCKIVSYENYSNIAEYIKIQIGSESFED